MSTVQKPASVPYIKVTLFHYRKPGVSEADFYKHWTEIFAPLAAPWLAQHGIVRYTQYHTPSALRALADPITKVAGFRQLDYDGHTEWVVPSVEVLMKALGDPEYQAKFKDEREKYMDVARTTVTVGWEEVKVADEKSVV